jgi:hypothetical protein
MVSKLLILNWVIVGYRRATSVLIRYLPETIEFYLFLEGLTVKASTS